MSGLTRIECLGKDNYETWRIQAECLLVKNDGWLYVNGKLPKPSGDDVTALAKWEIDDAKAKADIILSISPSEVRHVKGCSTSRDVWLRLESIYASRGPAKKATLLKKLITYKINEDGNILDEMSTFFGIVDKLESMDIPIHEDLQSSMLLHSLPSSYDNFRCAIESRDELPKAEILKVKILEEFECRKAHSEVQDGVMYARRDNKPYNYKMEGSSRSYYDKNRASSSRDNKPGSSTQYNREKKVFVCYRCKRPGHKASECREDIQRSTHSVNNVENGLMNLNVSDSEECNIVIPSKQQWVLDSGCTSHLCNDERKFGTLKVMGGKLNLANSMSTDVKGKGVVTLSALGEGSIGTANLNDTLFVPDLRTNLISVSKITDNGYTVDFSRDFARIRDSNGNVRLKATRLGNLYYLQECEMTNAVTNDKVDVHLWHERLGHLNVKDVIKLLNKAGKNVNVNDVSLSRECDVCAKGKMTALPFSKSSGPCDEKLNIVYSDIVGPMRCESNGGSRYFITFIDDCTRWCEIYFLKSKCNALDAFKDYKKYVENLLGSRIKYLQTDNGGEYCSTEFDNFLRNAGIQRRLTVSRTPQQNGVAERMNRTIVEMARCMLMNCDLSPSFWAEAVATACFIRNRCPTSALGGEIPYEKWFEKPVKIGYLRKFGAKVFILDKNSNKDKFAPRGIPGVFVGYSKTSKGFRVWVPEQRKFVVSRDIIFYESIVSDNRVSDSTVSNTSDFVNRRFVDFIFCDDFKMIPQPTQDGSGDIINVGGNTIPNVEPSQNTIPDVDQNVPGIIESGTRDEGNSSQITLRRGPGRPKLLRTGQVGRPKKVYKMVELTNDPVNDADVSEEETRSRMEEPNGSGGDEEFRDCVDFVGAAEVSLDDALQSEEKKEWEEAILSEIRSLVQKDTWDIVKRPKNRNVVGCRYVLTTKVNVDKTTKKKARLVAQGFSQRFGVDYDKTFAPVARLDSVRLLMALAVELNLEIHQLDINTAYLNGYLDEEIYMRSPRLLRDCLWKLAHNRTEDPSLIKRATKMLQDIDAGGDTCLLRKSLYGLKQAGRQWNKRLDTKLKDMRLSQSYNEPCLYFRKQNDEHLFVLVFVDDILVASQKEDRIARFKIELNKEFELKDYGRVKYFLGIDVERTDNVIKLSQKKYIQEILQQYNMLDCNPVKTPSILNNKLIPEKNEIQEVYPYKELIGHLMYLSISTRPDITNTVTRLSQFSTKPEKRHWLELKRVLRYLKNTINYGLIYKQTGKFIKGYCDSDWGGCPVDRKSFSGYAFILSDACISWSSRKQRCVATSSCEAEYVSLSEAMKEGVYLQSLLNEIGLEKYAYIQIHADSQSAIFLAQDPVFHARSKHIDIRYHFIRDVLKENKLISLTHVSTDNMLADVLTKSLPSEKHYQCIEGLGVKPC